MGVLASRTYVFLFFFIFFLLLQIIQTSVASLVIQPHMERRLVDVSGFISIDCGSSTVSYQHNGMPYVSDDQYIRTGENRALSSIYESTWQLLMTVRSFPDGRRNCYNLHSLKPNNKYLIRARFMYGNYDSLNVIPQFDIYIGINLWFTVTLLNAGTRLIKEIIHLSTATSIDVCLVNTGKGMPFISSLELRPLDNSSYPASSSFSLALWNREDIGISYGGDGRYALADDGYDRLWHTSPTWPDWKTSTTNETIDVSQDNPLKVPPSVLMSVGEHDNSLVNLTNQYTDDILPNTQVYAYWYFAELELLGTNVTREFNIDITYGHGYKFGPISPKYLQLTTIASPRITVDRLGGFEFTLTKTDNSTRNPILNAAEVYTVLELPVALPTNQEDVDAITAIKDKYDVVTKIWQGDPCLPANYQWDGLNCTYDNNPPRITSLNLSSRGLTGAIPPSLSNLTSLKYLNLSNNGLTGNIPKFLAYLPLLHTIDLTGNNLSGPVPRELVEKASNNSIDLRLEGNLDVCKSYPCNEKTDTNKKRDQFIIPLLICIALVLVLGIIAITFLAFKRKKKQGLVDQTIKPKNKRFNSSDIVRITDNFKKVLGKGGFGVVYYGVLQDGTQVAVKILNDTSSPITVKQFCAEAELLTRIHHVNLVSLIGYCDEHANMALVYEYMSSGNLQMHLSERNEQPLSWKARIEISLDAAQGLEYLHSGCRPPIVHRDVKPANILLDETGHAKISDFGLSRFFTTNSQGAVRLTDLAGTRGYLDPEHYQVSLLSEKSDVYAFGIVLLQLLTGLPIPTKETDQHDDVIHIVDWVSPMVESGDISAILDKRLQGNLIVSSAWKFLEIAMECVKPTGDQRPRMSEVVADLKMCYAAGGFYEANAAFGFDSGKYSSNSNQPLDSSIVSEPSAR